MYENFRITHQIASNGGRGACTKGYSIRWNSNGLKRNVAALGKILRPWRG